jgi:hypothetical protein
MGFCHERPGHQNAESRLVVDWIAAAGHILNCGIGLYFLADIFGGAAISEIAPHQHSETVLYQGTPYVRRRVTAMPTGFPFQDT